MECTLILMPLTKETASLYAKKAKHKLHLSAQSSLTSETRHFDAQLILLRILRFSKYIKLIYYLVRLMWISASESNAVHSRYSLVNSQMQCSQVKHKHKSVMECTLILMPFTKETASLHAKPAKHKLHLSAQSSLTNETRHFDAQLILLRILRSSKYIKNTLN